MRSVKPRGTVDLMIIEASLEIEIASLITVSTLKVSKELFFTSKLVGVAMTTKSASE